MTCLHVDIGRNAVYETKAEAESWMMEPSSRWGYTSLEGRRLRERPKWMEEVEEELGELKVRRWRIEAKVIQAWREEG